MEEDRIILENFLKTKLDEEDFKEVGRLMARYVDSSIEYHDFLTSGDREMKARQQVLAPIRQYLKEEKHFFEKEKKRLNPLVSNEAHTMITLGAVIDRISKLQQKIR